MTLIVMTRSYTKAIYHTVLHINLDIGELTFVYPAIFFFEFIDYHDKLFSDCCM